MKMKIVPRSPVRQGVDPNDPIVVRHNTIYQSLLSHVTANSGIVLSLNPYGTAPLSGYVGVWANSQTQVNIIINDDLRSIPVDYTLTADAGANLLPLVGMAANSANFISIIIGGNTTAFAVLTNPVPPTDESIPTYPSGARFTGFPVIELTVPPARLPQTLQELYFISFAGRFNVGLDHNGTVRWYTTLDIPAFNTERVANGHFVGADPEIENAQRIFEFDMVGRVHKMFVLDNECHHSIWQMPNGNLLLPSEYTGTTREDGLSIVDFTTGAELKYYDIRNVMDIARRPVPRVEDTRDWIHINQSYLNVTNNLLISSGRHQAVFGINADTAELAFILGNHQDWGVDFQQYLLTPVDASGAPIYDLTDPSDIDRADKEFWNWGQHAVIEVPNNTRGMVEFLLLDNGNYRSRDNSKALLPSENYTRMVHYLINLNNMTVRSVLEYGKMEVGNRGYSSFVSNAYQLTDGNYLVNFGGVIYDENGRRRSATWPQGYSDITDPLAGDLAQGMVIIQEIDSAAQDVLIEFTCRSGRYKSQGEGVMFTAEFYSFRTRKHTLLP